jgi:hypothetical protein
MLENPVEKLYLDIKHYHIWSERVYYDSEVKQRKGGALVHVPHGGPGREKFLP